MGSRVLMGREINRSLEIQKKVWKLGEDYALSGRRMIHLPTLIIMIFVDTIFIRKPIHQTDI